MVHENDLPRFYQSLKTAAKRNSSNTLHIFAAVTVVDSTVAVKILTDMLRSDSILYSVFPVYGYTEILSHSSKGMNDSSQPYVAVFINCGATEYLPNLQNALPYGSQTSVFIIDCHRPIHLSNLSSQQVTVLWTLNDQQQEGPILSDLSQYAISESSDDNEGGEDEEEKEDDDDDDEEDVYANVDERDGSEEVDENENANGENGKKKNEKQAQIQSRRKRRRRREGKSKRERRRLRMEYYNRGSFYGRPSGYLMYEIAHSLHKDSAEHLWLACVSLTDQLVYSRIPMEKYHEGFIELEQQVTSSGSSEVPRSASLEDGRIRVRVPDLNRIHHGIEFRLMCLHRWNLFDSMKYSSYPCTKLKTWTEPGMKRLRLFFSKLGIRNADAEQKYTYMSSTLKHRFRKEVDQVSSEFGLNEFSFQSFQRFHGYKMKVSAADMVYGLTGILESPSQHLSPEDRYEYFWDAMSAMDVRGWGLLEKGMDRAIQIQSTIVKQAIHTLAKKGKVKKTYGKQRFQWMLLEDDAGVDMSTITHPLTLTRFAHFFMDAQKELGERPKATVVAALPPNQKKAFIVGVASRQPQIGQRVANTFSIHFAKAVERMGRRMRVDFRQDLFESSYCEISKEQLNVFFQELATAMNE